MGIYIEKFIVVNNYGTIEFGDGRREVSFSASKANNGATGVTVADFVNGRRVRNSERDNLSEVSAVPEMPREEAIDPSDGISL